MTITIPLPEAPPSDAPLSDAPQSEIAQAETVETDETLLAENTPQQEAAEAATDAHDLDQDIDFLAPAVETDELGRLGDYRVLEVMGIGGMGVVHFVHDHGERVVLPLEVWAVAPDIRSDRPYRINIALKADYGQPGISFEHDDGTPLTDGDRDGRPDVSAPTGDTRIPIRMVFDRFDHERV